MARRSWTSLIKESGASDKDEALPDFGVEETSEFTPKLKIPGLADGAPNDIPAMATPDLEEIKKQAPQIGLLMEQRKALENQMNSLVSGQDIGGSTDPRFPVQTFAQRQDEIRNWEKSRGRFSNFGDPMAGTRELMRRKGYQDRTQFTPSAIENGLSRITRTDGQGSNFINRFDSDAGLGKINEKWRKTGLAKSLSKINDGTRLKGVQKGLKSVADKADELRKPLSDLSSEMDKLNTSLDDADRQLKEKGVSESERAEIRSDLDKSMGGSTDKIAKYSKKADEALNKPRELANGIERGWKKRRDMLEAPMDRFGPYVKKRKERLSTTLGGSGNLLDLAMRNRKRALERRRAKKEEEERDQKRRDLAAQKAAEKRKNG